MPKLQRPIPESDQLVVRAIAIQVVQEILVDRLALPIDMTINFPGYSDTVSQPHGLISNKYEPNRFPTSDKMFLEITENYVEDWMPSMATKIPEHIPLFQNTDLEVEMRPIYASMEMRFALHYRAKNKTDARKFYDFMMLKLPNREDTWLHKLNYSFGIPDVFMEILKEIHRLTELQDGYGDDFDTFFAKWVNPRYGLLTDQVGKNTLGVFSETQIRCIGYFDIDKTPDWGARKDETDVWEVEIPYVLRYEKPKDVYFSYPLVIHNTVLSNKYRGNTGFERLQDAQQSRTFSMTHLKAFESMQNVGAPYNDFPGRYFPLYDEFMPRNVPQNTMRIFTCLVMLDDNPEGLLMNIKDLEDPAYGMLITDCIKGYMASEMNFITAPRQSAVHLGLYSNRLLLDGSFLRIDEDLNVYATSPLSKRKYYHLRLSVITDLTYLTEDAKLRLRRYPCAFENIIEYVLPTGSKQPVPIIVGGQITSPSYDQIAETLKGRTVGNGMRTVQNTNMNAIYQIQK